MNKPKWYLVRYRERSGETEHDGKFLVFTADVNKAIKTVLSGFYFEDTDDRDRDRGNCETGKNRAGDLHPARSISGRLRVLRELLGRGRLVKRWRGVGHLLNPPLRESNNRAIFHTGRERPAP